MLDRLSAGALPAARVGLSCPMRGVPARASSARSGVRESRSAERPLVVAGGQQAGPAPRTDATARGRSTASTQVPRCTQPSGSDAPPDSASHHHDSSTKNSALN